MLVFTATNRLLGRRAMPEFIFAANIAHYNELLATEPDAGKIAILRKLLAEEEAKLADGLRQNPKPKAGE